jgi:hypothetical protein
MPFRQMRQPAVLSVFFYAAVLLQACSNRSAASASADHIRGTVQSLDGQVLTLATSAGSVRVQLAQSTKFATVAQSDRAHITGGSFLGIASVTEPDGSQHAVEVHVFSEAMRGSGEGSYGWDVPDAAGGRSKMTNGTAVSSRMTNGTVSSSRMTNGTVISPDGQSSLTLQYKEGASDGSQTIIIPPGIPIVTVEPGQSGELHPGVHVFVVAHRSSEGTLIADRVAAGKNGVVPPM